jgi:hypothetical protein
MKKNQQEEITFTQFMRIDTDGKNKISISFWISFSLSILSLPFLAIFHQEYFSYLLIIVHSAYLLIKILLRFKRYKLFIKKIKALKKEITGINDLILLTFEKDMEKWFNISVVCKGLTSEEISILSKDLNAVTKTCYYTVDETSAEFPDQWKVNQNNSCSGLINNRAALKILSLFNLNEHLINHAISISIDFKNSKMMKHKSYTGD